MSKVSILIPCYNADRWIAQSIQSALDQTYLNKEVIVVDDGSSDRSLEIIKSFGDRIRWETGENRGSNAARNRLLELSDGEWLQYLDADDYLLPQKITQQVQYLGHVPTADVLYSPTIYEYWQDGCSHRTTYLIPEPHDPWILLARWYLPQTGSPLWRRQALLDVGSWKHDQPCCQEHELYLRLLMAGKHFEYCPNVGAVYRQWSETTLCKKDKSQTQFQRLLIKDRLEDFLKKQGQLTLERQHAINQARFECARMIWLSNKQWANRLIHQIKLREPSFLPSGNAAPLSYRLVYKLLGFSVAEHVASLRRGISNLLTILPPPN